MERPRIKIYVIHLIGLAGFLSCLLFCTAFLGCGQNEPSISPPGYDLNSPKKFILGEDLKEISGITFLHGNPDTIYGIEDESGRLYYFKPGDKKYTYKKFGKRGDYEDLANLGDTAFVVLRSDGSLFEFPADFIRSGDLNTVRTYEQLLPSGEYEGLFSDQEGRIVALCKNCPDQDKERMQVSAYWLKRDAAGGLAVTEHFQIDISGVKLTSINRKIRFRPSCLARHPLTREWYIVSSVNKVLLVLDSAWKVKASYALDPHVFKQPEGLAFDRSGNMYISNEGQGGNANVLLFSYTQPK